MIAISAVFCLFIIPYVLSGCPAGARFGTGPPDECTPNIEPNGLPPAPLEDWFTKEMFEDLFPKANIGWGPHPCFPYNYESFVIAARYFPSFGHEYPDNGYTPEQNRKRDLAAFFSHAVQETGENDASLYINTDNVTLAHECYYRGGFYNWFEGGPISSFLPKDKPGFQPTDGDSCNFNGRYCISGTEYDYFYKCSDEKMDELYKGCYFGRGAIQISYNFNYGPFQQYLETVGIYVDLLKEPNLIMTKRDPPLAIFASLWFYMTPQPPKPAMHDIIMGNWEPGQNNRDAGYSGPIFGPTSLIINNECNGEDESEPGGPGESRRIKAFKWFTSYFGVPREEDQLLSCKGMPTKLAQIRHPLSYQPDWSTTWKVEPCNCAPASYGGLIPYFKKGYYPDNFVELNEENRLRCIETVYDNPKMYSMNSETSACLNVKWGNSAA